jgi:hypothetical protein
MKRILLFIILAMSIHAQDMLVTFTENRVVDLFSQAEYDYYIDNYQHINSVNGQTYLYLPVSKHVTFGETYAILDLGTHTELVNFRVNNKAVVLKNLQMDAWYFDFKTKAKPVLHKAVSDAWMTDICKAEIIKKIERKLKIKPVAIPMGKKHD